MATAQENSPAPVVSSPARGQVNTIKPLSPPSTKRYLSPVVEFTGAGVAADNARHRKEAMAREATMTSHNPAHNLFGAGVSKTSDAPRRLSNPSLLHPDDRNGHRSGSNSGQPSSPRDQYPPMQPPQALQSNLFALPRQTSPGEMEPSKSPSTANSRKRPHSSSSPGRSPTFSTYPPITPLQPGLGPRTTSLPTPSRSDSKVAKKHRCPHCSTEFTRHHNLKSHLLTHSQEKPYGCDSCDSRFRRLHDLKRHVKLHTGERPHVCEICGRAFARGDALARHNKVPGGCAGRRESGVDEGDLDIDGDIDMDDDRHDGSRRKSEPNKRSRRSSTRNVLDGQQGSTYPPTASMQSYTSSGRGMSPPQQPRSIPGFSSVQYNQAPSAYSTGGVTESPKPLSPMAPETHRGSDASARGRSPSISTRLAQQQLIRGSTSGTPPTSLPLPQSLPSITTDPRFSTSRYPPPSISTTGLPSGTHSGPPSGGPHSAGTSNRGSGSSRDLYAGHPSISASAAAPYPTQHESSTNNDDPIAMIRHLQERNEEERQARAREREENHRLRDELDLMRARMAQIQQAAQGPQSSSAQSQPLTSAQIAASSAAAIQAQPASQSAPRR